MGGGAGGGTQEWPCNRQVQAAHQEARQKTLCGPDMNLNGPVSTLPLLASSERTKTISMRKYELGHLETTLNGKSNSNSTIVTGASFQILFMMHRYTMTLLYVSAFCKSSHLVWKNDCIKKFNFKMVWFKAFD